jgi:hypothetical protein
VSHSPLSFIGDFVGNAGAEIGDIGKGLGPAAWNFVKGVYEDTTDIKKHGKLIGGSSLYKDVAKPLAGQYAYTYAGKGAPPEEKDWGFLRRFYEHPVGPVLDALTVASLGAGAAGRAGSTLAKAGKIAPEHPLARIRNTTGRPSLPLDTELRERAKYNPEFADLVIPEAKREYSQRPLRKGIQILTDKAGEKVPLIAQTQRKLTGQKRSQGLFAREGVQEVQAIANAVGPIIPELNKLTPAEAQAFDYIGRGTVTEAAMDLREAAVEQGLDPEADIPSEQKYKHYSGSVDPGIAEARTRTSDEVRDLVENPEQSDNLMEALSAYYDTVEERVSPDIGEEDAVRAKKYELVDALKERFPDEDPEAFTPRPDYPFPEPTVMPSDVATNFEYYTPGFIGKKLGGREEGYAREKKGRIFTPSNITYQNLFQETPRLSFYPRPDPLIAGVHRPDVRSYADLLAKHERDMLSRVFNAKSLEEGVLRDANGEPIKVSQNEPHRYGPNWIAVDPELPYHWFSKETSIGEIADSMRDQGMDTSVIDARMKAEAEDFVLNVGMMARRNPAYLMPREKVEYQYKLERASRPYENAATRWLARAHNVWRTYTLALMLRWGVNTVVGSFALNMTKGVRPRHYRIAQGLQKQGVYQSPETAGVNLGSVSGMELMSDAAYGSANEGFSIKQGAISNKSMQAVQGSENYFRRASLIHSIDKEAKRLRDEGGAEIEEALAPPATWDPEKTSMVEHRLDYDEVMATPFRATLYHGTSSEAGASIYREGFDPSKSKSGDMASYLSTSPNETTTIAGDGVVLRADVELKNPVRKVWDPNKPGSSGLLGDSGGWVFYPPELEDVHYGRWGKDFGPLGYDGSIRDLGPNAGGKHSVHVQVFDPKAVTNIRIPNGHELTDELSEVIKNFEDTKGPRSVDEYADWIVDHPEEVQRAIDDVDRFAYNFSALGPNERRYVRQFVPFWGWYKFISALHYRLPIDYPGRANLLANMGILGTAQNEEAWGGPAPAWLKAAIPLTDPDKGFMYLSTMGLNPFSQVFNPAGEEGPIQGTIHTGQLSPWIQAVLTGIGYDTLRGGQVPISAKSGVSPDFFGGLLGIDEGGDKSIATVESGNRFLASILRSFPQYRLTERGPRTPLTPFSSGGRSVYPESLPWHQRFMPTKPESKYGGSFADIFAQWAGIAPKPFDLRGYQRLYPKRLKYARTRNRNNLRKELAP